jgi:hypothetical protein
MQPDSMADEQAAQDKHLGLARGGAARAEVMLELYGWPSVPRLKFGRVKPNKCACGHPLKWVSPKVYPTSISGEGTVKMSLHGMKAQSKRPG